jgi:hypothetical protein
MTACDKSDTRERQPYRGALLVATSGSVPSSPSTLSAISFAVMPASRVPNDRRFVFLLVLVPVGGLLESRTSGPPPTGKGRGAAGKGSAEVMDCDGFL